jgi:hypothetical protein
MKIRDKPRAQTFGVSALLMVLAFDFPTDGSQNTLKDCFRSGVELWSGEVAGATKGANAGIWRPWFRC